MMTHNSIYFTWAICLAQQLANTLV